MIDAALHTSILGRAHDAGMLSSTVLQLRAFSHRKDKAAHHAVDDAPCGGGAGMIVRVDVAHDAIAHAIATDDAQHPAATRRVVLVEPRGALFTQATARRFSSYQHLVFVCGRYEGTDARVERYVDETVSIGDYVLTGGELAALAIFDASARLVPGVLGNATSAVTESHSEALLEHRQYSKPNSYHDVDVPAVLLSGNHKDIARAQRKDSLTLTATRRPDLFAQHTLTAADRRLLQDDDVAALEPARKVRA